MQWVACFHVAETRRFEPISTNAAIRMKVRSSSSGQKRDKINWVLARVCGTKFFQRFGQVPAK